MEPSTAQKERVARRARTGSGAGVGEKGNSAIARRFISLPKHSYGVVIIMPVDVFQSLSRCMCSIYTHRRCYDRSCGGVLGLLDFFRTRRVLGEANLFFNFEDLQCHRERRQMLCIGTSCPCPQNTGLLCHVAEQLRARLPTSDQRPQTFAGSHGPRYSFLALRDIIRNEIGFSSYHRSPIRWPKSLKR